MNYNTITKNIKNIDKINQYDMMSDKDFIDIMTLIEGYRETSYKCTAGKVSIGFGYNMDGIGAENKWNKLKIKEDFDDIYYGEEKLSRESALILLYTYWYRCELQAYNRCRVLGIDYNLLPRWHKFILADIVYNTGSIKNWKQVIVKTKPTDILVESRRKPHKLLDSRVVKIGKFFNLISTNEDAHKLGIDFI